MNTKISYGIHKKDLLLKHQENKQQKKQFQEKALQEAQRIAEILVVDFNIGKVFLVGPLTYGELCEGMNLELALDGIPQGAYAKALAHVKQSSSFGVELIDLQQADSWTKRSMAKHKKLLAKK